MIPRVVLSMCALHSHVACSYPEVGCDQVQSIRLHCDFPMFIKGQWRGRCWGQMKALHYSPGQGRVRIKDKVGLASGLGLGLGLGYCHGYS